MCLNQSDAQGALLFVFFLTDAEFFTWSLDVDALVAGDFRVRFTVFFAGVLAGAVFFVAAFLAGVLFAGVFLAEVFCATTFLAGAFLAVGVLAG